MLANELAILAMNWQSMAMHGNTWRESKMIGDVKKCLAMIQKFQTPPSVSPWSAALALKVCLRNEFDLKNF